MKAINTAFPIAEGRESAKYKAMRARVYTNASEDRNDPYLTMHLLEYEIIVTDFETVRNEYVKMKAAIADSREPVSLPIPSTEYHRCILDEAHRIRNGVATTVTAAAVNAIRSTYRIAMTGTPSNNEYTNVRGIIEFLRVPPWNDQRLFISSFIKKPRDRDDRNAV